jgi:hypothetical protein
VWSDCGPYDELGCVILTGAFLQAVDERQKNIAQRPVHYGFYPVRVEIRDAPDYAAEAAEVAGASFSVAGAFSVGLEDFGEVRDDASPN